MALVARVLALALALVATPALAEESPPTRMKSPALAASGVGILVLGLGTGVGAGFLTWWAVSVHSLSTVGGDTAPVQWLGLAVPMQALAVGGIAGGIVMMAIGLKRVPVEGVAIGPAGLRVAW